MTSRSSMAPLTVRFVSVAIMWANSFEDLRSFCNPRNFAPYRQSMDRNAGEGIKGRGCLQRPFRCGAGGDVWRRRQRLCKLMGMPWRYGSGNGATAPSLFRRGRRGGQPDAGGGETAAYGAAFPQSPNPRSRI